MSRTATFRSLFLISDSVNLEEDFEYSPIIKIYLGHEVNLLIMKHSSRREVLHVFVLTCGSVS